MYFYTLQYCIKEDDPKCKRAKGMDKNVVAKMKHENYKNILSNRKYIRREINRIRSKGRNIGSHKI